MLLWNVKLFDKVLVTVTEKATAEGLIALLNNGSLHGVAGDPAAYEDARGLRSTEPVAKATFVTQVEPRPAVSRKKKEDTEEKVEE